MDSVTCPVCSQSYKQLAIEKHVNSCLLRYDEKPKTRNTKTSNTNSAKKETNSFFQKRSVKRKSLDPINSDAQKKIIIDTFSKSEDDASTEQPKLPCLSDDSDVVIISEKRSKSLNDPLAEVNNDKENKKEVINTAKLTPFQQDLLNWSTESAASLKCSPKETLENQPYDNGDHPDKPGSALMSNEHLHEKHKAKKVKLILGKIPLAEQMRPKSLDEYYGQEAVNSQKVLKDLFYNDSIPSMILWGPPGCGKTSLASIIAERCKSQNKYRFVTLSATMSGVNDVKEAVKIAKNEKRLTQRKTVLFIDEVHRFNKLQQDTFLPHVEDGTLVLIGATTENPSFHVNNALMSRCRVVVLQQLQSSSIMKIIQDAVQRLGGLEVQEPGREVDQDEYKFTLENGVIKLLADFANGDARIALNSLDMMLQSKLKSNDESKQNVHVTCEEIKQEMKSNQLNYDRNGDEHYDIISALHKSIRGSDVDASLYWLARMLEGGETPLYIARRLVRIASEDIGMGDPTALQQTVSAYQACHFIGMPECDVILAQAVIYLAKAPKSVSVYEAYGRAKTLIKNWQGSQPGVPLHLRNAPTTLLKKIGYGQDYKYTPHHKDDPAQDYLPPELLGKKFFVETT